MEIPGYDLRRLIMAQDPLAAVNAFFVQIRTILATVLGMRMCPLCPHCTDNPCQDAMGSVAELMGGCAGRADALIGAVECQKSNGSLHFHWFLFVQRLHQFGTLQEIGELLEKAVVNSTELKEFLENLCVTSYTDLSKHVAEKDELENNFPVYSEKTECGSQPVWGDMKLGRIPEFLYADSKEEEPQLDATSFKKKFH